LGGFPKLGKPLTVACYVATRRSPVETWRTFSAKLLMSGAVNLASPRSIHQCIALDEQGLRSVASNKPYTIKVKQADEQSSWCPQQENLIDKVRNEPHPSKIQRRNRYSGTTCPQDVLFGRLFSTLHQRSLTVEVQKEDLS
jgi:hypothetical protein